MNQPPSESIRAAANTIRAINNAAGDNASHTGISPHDLDILAAQRANAETEEHHRVTSAARELAGILTEASASSAINEDLTVQDCAEIAHTVIDAGYTRDAPPTAEAATDCSNAAADIPTPSLGEVFDFNSVPDKYCGCDKWMISEPCGHAGGEA